MKRLLILILLLGSLTFPVYADSPQGCTSLVVTGFSSVGGWAILAKNSDTDNNPNEYPIHVPSKTFSLTYATSTGVTSRSVSTWAYSGCNSYMMSGSRMPTQLNPVVWGMNERGLAAAYTQLDPLGTVMNVGVTSNPQGLGTRGRELCTLILALYDNVDAVLADINNPDSVIGPNNRRNADSIEIIDRYGKGAVIEVSISKAVYKRVVNTVFPEDNVIRMWDMNPQGEASSIRDVSDSGVRTGYILEGYDQAKNWFGQVSYKDVVKTVVRYIHNKEDGSAPFSINEQGKWEIVNDGTSSSMVAISGNQQYEGKLNALWGTYGNPAIIGLYLPMLPYADKTPDSLRSYVEYTVKPYTLTGGLYDPIKVMEMQTRAFEAEDYTFNKYETLLSTIGLGLTDTQLQNTLNSFVADSQANAVNIYKTGSPQEYSLIVLIILGIITFRLIQKKRLM